MAAPEKWMGNAASRTESINFMFLMKKKMTVTAIAVFISYWTIWLYFNENVDFNLKSRKESLENKFEKHTEKAHKIGHVDWAVNTDQT